MLTFSHAIGHGTVVKIASENHRVFLMLMNAFGWIKKKKITNWMNVIDGRRASDKSDGT